MLRAKHAHRVTLKQNKNDQVFDTAVQSLIDSFELSTLKPTEGRAQRQIHDKDMHEAVIQMAKRAAATSRRR